MLATGDNRFFSLGFGGTLTVGFSAPLAAGQQIRIIETTWGACRAEVVRVDASQDGTDWCTIGVATNGRLPPDWLGSDNTPTVLSVGASGVRFIRMTDVSDRTSFPWYQDGFDVESIAAVGGLGQAETAWSAGKPFSGSNWATYTEHMLGAATSPIAKFVADAAPVVHKIDVMET